MSAFHPKRTFEGAVTGVNPAAACRHAPSTPERLLVDRVRLRDPSAGYRGDYEEERGGHWTESRDRVGPVGQRGLGRLTAGRPGR